MQRNTASKIGCVSALDLVTRRQTSFVSFAELVEAALDKAYTPSLKCKLTIQDYSRVDTLASQAQSAAECCVLADAFDETMRQYKRTVRVVRT